MVCHAEACEKTGSLGKNFQPERAKMIKMKMRSWGLPFTSYESGKIFLHGNESQNISARWKCFING
jgi:hypothetical protein